jgi:hypothetical protein
VIKLAIPIQDRFRQTLTTSAAIAALLVGMLVLAG